MQENIRNGSCPIKLFLVDEHLVLRQALSKAFNANQKYEVIGHAADSAELLSQISACSPDVIVLDFAIPSSSCLETMLSLKKLGCQAPVLILSATENGNNIRAALQAGARGFVPKQSGLSEMEFAIDAIVDGGTYLSPSVTDKFMSGDDEANNGPASLLAKLSHREREIMVHLANGHKNKDIGQQLHISTRTVDTHRSNILRKLGIKSNAELAKIAISAGLISS